MNVFLVTGLITLVIFFITLPFVRIKQVQNQWDNRYTGAVVVTDLLFAFMLWMILGVFGLLGWASVWFVLLIGGMIVFIGAGVWAIGITLGPNREEGKTQPEDEEADLAYHLAECNAELARHHRDFAQASVIIESMRDNLRNFEGDDPNMVVGYVQSQVRELRNIIPPPE